VAGDGLVHGIIKQFGGKVMHRAFVAAADIHCGTTPDGFQPLQNFDIAGRIRS
jgi:hypothetical protein